MKEKKKLISWQNIITFIWMPFVFFMTAVDLIQIGENFLPTIHEWTSYIEYSIEKVRQLKVIIFTPLEKIFGEISPLVKNYLMLGLLFTITWLSSGLGNLFSIFSSTEFREEFTKEDLKKLIYEDGCAGAVLIILSPIILTLIWPLGIISQIVIALFIPYASSSTEQSDEERKLLAMYKEMQSSFVKTIVLVFLLAIILLLVNYFSIQIEAQLAQ